jgi:hypothetical protein
MAVRSLTEPHDTQTALAASQKHTHEREGRLDALVAETEAQGLPPTRRRSSALVLFWGRAHAARHPRLTATFSGPTHMTGRFHLASLGGPLISQSDGRRMVWVPVDRGPRDQLERKKELFGQHIDLSPKETL